MVVVVVVGVKSSVVVGVLTTVEVNLVVVGTVKVVRLPRSGPVMLVGFKVETSVITVLLVMILGGRVVVTQNELLAVSVLSHPAAAMSISVDRKF